MMITGDILPVPPASFCQRLRQFDDRLALVWDTARRCWSVFCRESDGSNTFVLSVVDDRGEAAPLDERVVEILRRNRWYAQHPEALAKAVVDDPAAKRERALQNTKENLRHACKDRSLRKRFDAIREMARSVSKTAYSTPHAVRRDDGTILTQYNETTQRDEPVIWKPDASWQGA